MARKVIYIVGGVVVVLVLVAALLPFVIDANRFRPEIESSLNSALNRKVDIGNIRLSIFSGGVRRMHRKTYLGSRASGNFFSSIAPVTAETANSRRPPGPARSRAFWQRFSKRWLIW